jgi:Polysaccharide lyase
MAVYPHRILRRLCTTSLALLLISPLWAGRAEAATVSADSFEGIDSMTWAPISGSSLKQYTDAEGGSLYLLAGSPYLPTINKQAAVAGSQSMCVSVGVPGTHDTHSDRGEVQIAGTGGSGVRVGSEYWYSFNVRPAPNLKPNPVDPSRNSRVTDVVFQIHNTTSPALSGPPMVLQTDGLTWGFAVRGSSDPARGYNADGQSIPLGPVHLGAWTNFVLDVKFNTNGQGWLRIWENGTLMFDQQVSNTYPDASSTSHGAFAKFGVYAWWLQSIYPFQAAALADGNTSRDYCHDRIRVGDAGSSCPALVPTGIQCDPVPASHGYRWNGTTPIKAGPPDTHATPAYLPIRGVTATDSIEGQPPANAVDGNQSTYWSSSVNGAYLQLDLGAVRPDHLGRHDQRPGRL